MLAACASGNSGNTDEDGAVVTDLPASCVASASSTGQRQGELGNMQAVGDSILAYNDVEAQSIPDVVGRELNISMRNNAVGGAMLTPTNDESIASQYEPGNYSHVLVNGGGNDFSAQCSRPVLDSLIAPNLQSGLMVELVNTITGDGAQAVIVGYYLPRDRETGCEYFPELLSRYRELAQQRDDTMYICTAETIRPDTPALYASPDDPVHPSPAGSRAVGLLIADHLRR
ncbi:MAG: SGNH/GDSL hydrolase family protein [Deinococcota bacterium]